MTSWDVIWTIDSLMLNGPKGTSSSEIWIEIQISHWRLAMRFKTSSAKWSPYHQCVNKTLTQLNGATLLRILFIVSLIELFNKQLICR